MSAHRYTQKDRRVTETDRPATDRKTDESETERPATGRETDESQRQRRQRQAAVRNKTQADIQSQTAKTQTVKTQTAKTTDSGDADSNDTDSGDTDRGDADSGDTDSRDRENTAKTQTAETKDSGDTTKTQTQTHTYTAETRTQWTHTHTHIRAHTHTHTHAHTQRRHTRQLRPMLYLDKLLHNGGDVDLLRVDGVVDVEDWGQAGLDAVPQPHPQAVHDEEDQPHQPEVAVHQRPRPFHQSSHICTSGHTHKRSSHALSITTRYTTRLG